MGTLNQFLDDKRVVLEAALAAAMADPKPVEQHASVTVRGRSGVRVIKVRQFEMINDTEADFGGFDLGPTSPEHQLVALGGCIAHTAEMVAAFMRLSIEKIDVDVTASIHPLAQTPGYEHIPFGPYNMKYTLRIESTAPAEQLATLHQQVVATCPLYNFLTKPQVIPGSLVVSVPEAAAP